MGVNYQHIYIIERKLTSVSKSAQPEEGEERATSGKGGLRKIFNRHALPDEIKEIVLGKSEKPIKE